MFKVRNLLGVGSAIMVMLALTTAGAFAQPALQATVTPEATATVEATEEAILNALTMATTVVGRDGHRVEAISLARLRELLASHKP